MSKYGVTSVEKLSHVLDVHSFKFFRQSALYLKHLFPEIVGCESMSITLVSQLVNVHSFKFFRQSALSLKHLFPEIVGCESMSIALA